MHSQRLSRLCITIADRLCSGLLRSLPSHQVYASLLHCSSVIVFADLSRTSASFRYSTLFLSNSVTSQSRSPKLFRTYRRLSIRCHCSAVLTGQVNAVPLHCCADPILSSPCFTAAMLSSPSSSYFAVAMLLLHFIASAVMFGAMPFSRCTGSSGCQTVSLRR